MVKETSAQRGYITEFEKVDSSLDRLSMTVLL